MIRLKTLFILFTIVGLSSCNDFEGDDANLHGVWSNGLQTYYFNDDMSYYYTNNFTGDTITPVKFDSVFGVYSVDTRRNNITLEITGYRFTGTDSVVYTSLNGTTWNYSISNDKLNYTSNTSVGSLDKQ